MRRFFLAAVVLTVSAVAIFGQTKAPKVVRRAQPPKPKSDAFFADAFQEGLVGDRPATLGKAGGTGTGSSATSAPDSGSGLAATASGRWSELISPATIEDAIKAMKQQIDKDVTTLSDFKGKGHKLA